MAASNEIVLQSMLRRAVPCAQRTRHALSDGNAPRARSRPRRQGPRPKEQARARRQVQPHRPSIRAASAAAPAACGELVQGTLDGIRCLVSCPIDRYVYARVAVGDSAHQALLPNPLLAPAVELCRDVGALGVCRAHSGTLLGLLLDQQQLDVTRALEYARGVLPASITLARQAMVGGGPRILTSGLRRRRPPSSFTRPLPSL